MSSPKPPTPDPAGDYQKSLKTYLQYLPALLKKEQGARRQFDPQRIVEQEQLQDQFGPKQYSQQLQALQQLDPASTQIRGTLAAEVQRDLASGYGLPQAFKTQLQSQIRGSEAARGNVLGNAPIAAEDLYTGNAALQLYQQHLQNAGAFLAGPTPEQQLTLVQPVAPDRSSQYVNPSAPGQLAAPNYQNTLAAWQASGAGVNHFAGALSGAASGALTGSTVNVPYGTAAGAIAGGIGGYFSDERLKENIQQVGTSPSGIPIVEFNYRGYPNRFRGVLAQDVQRIKPEAVFERQLHDGDNGKYLAVDYDAIDVKQESI